MKTLLFIIILFSFGCVKEVIIKPDTCKTCTTITKEAGIIKNTYVFEECDEVEIYHLTHGHHIQRHGNVVTAKFTTCQ
jgi:hypothetical protein